MSIMKIFDSAVQRISRKTFWLSTLILYLIYGFLFFVMKIIADIQVNPNWWGVIQIVRLVFCLMFTSLIIKRFHDFNMSGWLCLFALIPICGYFYVFSPYSVTKALMSGLLFFGLVIGLVPGTVGQNKFGEEPS